jgi:hypothetical protein
MINKLLVLMFLCGFIFFTACSEKLVATTTTLVISTTVTDFFPVQTESITKTATVPENGQYFPAQTENPKVSLLALMQGKLKRDDFGYLRVNDDLMIWPYRFSCVIEGDNTWIIDEQNRKIIKVGDDVKIGGGEINRKQAQQAIGELLPENCIGPFYLVSTIVP